MTFIAVRCPYCHSDQIVKRGKTRRGTQRYLCHNTACTPQSFLLEYSYQGRLPEVKQQLIDMSLNASGVRDTARVLRISTDTVLRALRKKEAALTSVNTALLRTVDPAEIIVDIEQAGEAEVDEMWSFVGKKGNQRWLWHAIDHHTGAVACHRSPHRPGFGLCLWPPQRRSLFAAQSAAGALRAHTVLYGSLGGVRTTSRTRNA